MVNWVMGNPVWLVVDDVQFVCTDAVMQSISVANARGRFADLIDLVGSGQVVAITRRGREVARLVPSEQEGCPLPSRSVERAALLKAGAKAGTGVVRRMRDEERA